VLNKTRDAFLTIAPFTLRAFHHDKSGKNLFPTKPPIKAEIPAIITEVIRLVFGIKYSDKKTTIPTNRPVNKAIPILPFFIVTTSSYNQYYTYME